MAGARTRHVRFATLGGLAIAGRMWPLLGMLLPIESSPSIASCRADFCQPGLIARMWPFAPALAVLALGALDDLRPVSASAAPDGAGGALPAGVMAGHVAGISRFLRHARLGRGRADRRKRPLHVRADECDQFHGRIQCNCHGQRGDHAGQSRMAGACAAGLDTFAAISGFLVFNLAGKLYAGDAGALYVGFWIAGLGLLALRKGHSRSGFRR